MVALETPKAINGLIAPDFALKSTDGKIHALSSLKGHKGTVIMFICNHCPYVQKQLSRMVALTDKLAPLGVTVIAINPNDAQQYPEDSFENMQKFAAEMKFPFPYLCDESQSVARAYGAVCTPDIFGFDASLALQYRGRLDQSWSGMIDHPKEELFEAMQEIATTGRTSQPQNPSIGCSIKWKLGAKAAV